VLPDQLLEQINTLAETHAKAEVCHAMAHTVDAKAERDKLNGNAAYWKDQVADQYNKLVAALNTALPPTLYAVPDPLAPVRILNGSTVEVRGSFGARTVSVRYTSAQAVAVGAALIACAAVTDVQLGGNLATILPPLPPG
jgi:hypothetical protein